ncbi:hypothetical protein pipiens_003115 [Culex pipiens pipiens]|uniref:Alpha-carbonic anhydrase domain-containing protein n=1 Tax=Culex pipiens pipiens TaxID=38569 RepID=A0ABD1D6E0_CULPP
MIWLVLTVISSLFCSAWADGLYFTYGLGVEQWGMISKYCDGQRQSPIDLDTSIAKNVTEQKRLQLVNAAVNPTKVTVKNNGITVAFALTYPPSKQLVLRGGPLEGEFKFAGLHFHWGCEHSEDHQRYPMEMHLVFYNQDYKTVDEAQFQENGLAVLGYFFANSTKAKNQRWIDSLQSIKKTGSSYTFVHPQYMNIANLVGSDLRPYFSYDGSLTTPPCYETVSWIVHREPLLITNKQLKLFQSLRGKFGYMRDNYRPIQMLNEREITLYH